VRKTARSILTRVWGFTKRTTKTIPTWMKTSHHMAYADSNSDLDEDEGFTLHVEKWVCMDGDEEQDIPSVDKEDLDNEDKPRRM
jgi:hypothetical protein